MNKKTDLEKVAVQVKRTLTAQKRKQKLNYSLFLQRLNEKGD